MITPESAVAAALVFGFATGIATAAYALRPERRRSTALPVVDDLDLARAVGVVPAAQVVVDHVHCEGQCGAVLCNCLPLFDRPRCPGTVEQVCGHNNPLCEACAQAWCIECLAELGPSWIGGIR